MDGQHCSVWRGGYLKRAGFLLITFRQIDKALLRSLDGSQRNRITEIWNLRELGLSNGLEQYAIPHNKKQAALLFSHDWHRTFMSFDWCASIVNSLKPASIIEMGSGAGFMIEFLEQLFPTTLISGIDRQRNLVAISNPFCRNKAMSGDYLEATPNRPYDLIICNFGLDNSDFDALDNPSLIS